MEQCRSFQASCTPPGIKISLHFFFLFFKPYFPPSTLSPFLPLSTFFYQLHMFVCFLALLEFTSTCELNIRRAGYSIQMNTCLFFVHFLSILKTNCVLEEELNTSKLKTLFETSGYFTWCLCWPFRCCCYFGVLNFAHYQQRYTVRVFWFYNPNLILYFIFGYFGDKIVGMNDHHNWGNMIYEQSVSAGIFLHMILEWVIICLFCCVVCLFVLHINVILFEVGVDPVDRLFPAAGF